jgi:hypothetical protein
MLTSFIALGNAAKWLVRASRIQAEVARSSQQHRALPIRILNEHPLGSAAVVVVAVIVVVVALGRH